MDSLLRRLDISARRIADLRQEVRAEMDRRDEMIREALGTAGHKYKHVSQAAHRSIGTVAAIAAKPATD